MPFWKRKSSAGGSQDVSQHGPHGGISPVTQQSRTVSNQQVTAPTLPDDDLFLKRGDELFNEGNYHDAIFMYSKAVRNHPNSALIHLKLSIARQVVDPPEIEQALVDVSAAIRLEPAMGPAWKQKGDLYLQQKNFTLAEEAFVVATNMLGGLEKVHAQQALANARMQKNTTTSPSTLNQSTTILRRSAPQQSELPATNQPVRPPPSSIPASPQQPPSIAAQQSTNPAASAIPLSQRATSSLLSPAQPSINIDRPAATSPVSPSSPRAGTAAPTSPASPTIGLAPPTAQSPNRSPSPNPMSHGEVLAEQLDIPTEAPPSYTPNNVLPSSIPGLNTTGTAYTTQFNNMSTTLNSRRNGSLYLRPYTTADRLDSVQLNFYGRTWLEAILLDLPPQLQVHETWKRYNVNTIEFPGTTFIDHDCESQRSYDGHHKGTISVHGFLEEYREYQLSIQPPLELFFESPTIPPVISIDRIVERLRLLKLQPFEDNTALSLILGGGVSILGLTSTTTTAWIQNICTKFHRGQYDAPHRFVDFLKTGTLTRHVFAAGGIGLTNFLFHILLGYELYIRLLKGGNVKYPNIMRATTSALVVIAYQWMNNVSISQSVTTTPLGAPKYILSSNNHARQTEGLIRFAETIAWPYMDDLRRNMEGAYNNLINDSNSVDPYLRDWLYGLFLPGKYFRHRIMCCLVAATSATKHLGPGPYFQSGLIVGNKAYWPKRTVLGNVLGGLANPKSTCGWIGPVPAPTSMPSGWYRLSARLLNFVMPVVDDLIQSNSEILGFSDIEMTTNPQGFINEITDMNKWVPPTGLPARPNSNTTTATSTVRLAAIRFQEAAAATATLDKAYLPMLDFSVPPPRIGTASATVTFALYTNPVFVHVPKCEGSLHPMHDRLVKKHYSKIVLAKDLKNANVSVPTVGSDNLIIIDATEIGEEAMARAWCAESGRHAVVRKAGIGCFTCSVGLAQRRTGIGLGVLIWCQ